MIICVYLRFFSSSFVVSPCSPCLRGENYSFQASHFGEQLRQMMTRFLTMTFAVCAAVVVGATHSGHTQPVPSSPADVAKWTLETVTTQEGHVYRGLILDDSSSRTIEFLEVRRPPGKPMYLVVRPIERSAVVRQQRLDPAEREQLQQRIDRFKSHSQIEAQQMRRVELEDVSDNTSPRWQYEGPWFSLTTTTDEKTARFFVVHLEQVFRAFRQVVPPRLSKPASLLRFEIYGSRDEYYALLRAQGLRIQNPAFYDVRVNRITAGSDLQLLARQMAAWQRERDALLAELDDIDRYQHQRLETLRNDLQSQGLTATARRKIEVATAQKWDEQRKAILRRLSSAERRNATLQDQVIDRTLRRLVHEAFHAYLENEVYDDVHFDVPRWLNEGLAQVFEGGLLEDDVLRVDAPNRERLARLQDDLQSASPLRLSDLLAADQEAFLVLHDQPEGTESRQYLYCWGLAHYLAFEQRIIGSEALGRYVSLDAATQSPRERFEKLTALPLESFAAQWRQAMLALKASPGQQPRTEDSERDSPTSTGQP